MNATRTVLVAFVVATSAWALPAGAADHEHHYQSIANHAEEIGIASRELNDELRYHFRDSRLYGELITVNSRIRAKAHYLRSQARPSRHVSTVHRQVGELHALIAELDHLMDEVRFRVSRRLDRPIMHFRESRALVSNMHEAIDCLIREEANFGYGGRGSAGRWRDERTYWDDRGRSFENHGPVGGYSGREGRPWDGWGGGIVLRAGDLSVQLQR